MAKNPRLLGSAPLSPVPGMSRDLVIWCYRLFLGREPESEAVIQSKLHAIDRSTLIRGFLASPEFVAGEVGPKLGGGHYFDRSNPPIAVEYDPDPEQLAQMVERVASTWRALGESRPHWSVLSSDQFLPGKIAEEGDNFFASGAQDRDELLSTISRVGRQAAQFETVLEYGCGLGRITNHLSETFKAVIGCDISAAHLELARAHSEKIGAEGISYREITAPDYGMTSPVDLWFSIIVLQHNPPPVIAAILRRTFNMLRVGGLAIFQVPTYSRWYRFDAAEYLAQPQNDSFEMHVLPQAAIFSIVRDCGCRVLEVIQDERTGDADWLSNTFVVER